MTKLSLHALPFETQKWIWLAFFLAFAIKLPLFPFHTWLPLAHVEAPTLGSVILAAVLLKLGGYGLIRFPLTLLPSTSMAFQGLICGLSVISILYGSWVAFAQTDVKKMIAYSSVAHMGYVMLGLCSHHTLGVQGALFQMISHGLISGGLFLCIGMLYVRFHHRDLAFYGGLRERMPLFGGLFLALVLGSMALPGTCGFVGEFLVLLGTTSTWGGWVACAAGLGMVGSATYGLKCVHAVWWGPVSSSLPPVSSGFYNLARSESFVLLILVLSMIFLGLYPDILLKMSQPMIMELVP